MKRQKPILAVILYVAAALMALYSIFAFITCYTEVARAIETGQVVLADMASDIFNYFVTGFAIYLVDALILLGLGRILHRQVQAASSTSIEAVEISVEEEPVDTDDNIDGIFEDAVEDNAKKSDAVEKDEPDEKDEKEDAEEE